MGKVHNASRNASPDFGDQRSTPLVRALGQAWNVPDVTVVWGFQMLLKKLEQA